MRDHGWENGPIADAVLAAVGGSENLDRPPRRRVLLTVRCGKGHGLGRVISTRIGPVWIARPNRGRPPGQLPAIKQLGLSAPGNTEWKFAPLADAIFVWARCRCGTVAMPEGPRIGLQANAVRAEIAAGTRELVVDDNGVPIRRAR